ncbi:MAG TPA: thiamine-phosphate kinase [Candidatus Acidoferrum sp.]|jgi:thiamine-monophosphate kinase|nr:thiamine-phosphate kinase [Candidatus Acidoferrum sp.]
MNEDQLVTAIAALTGDARHVLIGIGDDAAVWQPSRSRRSVISSDMLVEDVHFSRGWMSPDEIGWRAMAANLSDLAAMGARPRLGTVALGVSPAWMPDALLACYRGMARCARTFGLDIAGGDLSRAPVLTIAITVVGDVRANQCKTRSGVRPNDVFATTGPLGASRAGLDVARGAVRLEEPLVSRALAAHCTPQPRIAQGRWLAASAHVHAMMDCSDGLSTDLARMARASGVGAHVERVPVADAAVAAASLLGTDPAEYALAGGEDFELLVAVEARAFEHLSRRFHARFGQPLERLGTARADEKLVMVNQGREEPIARTGWDHFSQRDV